MLATPGGLIATVRPGSVGAEIGLEPGDRLLAINGHPLRDEIDYRFYSDEETLELHVERAGETHRLQVERDLDEDLGLEFADPLFDGLHLCDNRCPFCFVRQMPPGLRRTLYLRDDDYRYSFLHGGFATLTNLTEADWARIGEQRLSPLYVSIHATDLAVRRKVLGNPEAPDILQQLRRLGDMGIAVHGQIVIWPGVNDGDVLRRSIEETAVLWPTVRSLAVVPVGLTRYHRDVVRLVTPDEARAIVELASAYHGRLRASLGVTWLYPSDELWLLAGRPVPGAAFYDSDAQLENGVGLVRGLLDDWAALRRRRRRRLGVTSVTLACGTLISPVMQQIAREMHETLGLEVQVVPVVNQLLGETVTVSGLLAGNDVLTALEGEPLGEVVALPRAMFDESGAVTLDDLTPAILSEHLGRPVVVAGSISELVQGLQRL